MPPSQRQRQYTPEYLRDLIERNGGDLLITRLAAESGYRLTPGCLYYWRTRGLTAPHQATTDLLRALEGAPPPPSPSEFRALVAHFGGPSGAVHHLAQHHDFKISRTTLHDWLRRDKLNHNAITAYELLALDKPKFKSREGIYRAPSLIRNRK